MGYSFCYRKEYPIVSESAAFEDIEPHMQRIWMCVSDAYAQYRQYPDLHVHRSGTRASLVNDLIFERLIREFDGVPGVKPLVLRDGMRLLSLSERISLWFKKVDIHRESKNYPTKQARSRNRGQSNLYGEEGQIVLAGYLLSDDETAVKRLSFSPPNRVRPRWWFEVGEPPVIASMAPRVTQNKGVQLQIKRGPSQIEIEG